MELRDLKYILAFTIPVVTLLSITYGGILAFLTVAVAFGVIPIIETVLPVNTENLSPEISEIKKKIRFFDILLYCNIIFVYGILYLLFYKLNTNTLQTYEQIGMIFSAGIMLGSNGINVAHELGHKSEKLAQLASKILLLPSLYMHFFIEHNRGHHLRVGTPDDPATSRYNELVFSFWFRSVKDGWLSAWKLENAELQKNGLGVISLRNQMIQFTLIQILWLIAVWWYFGISGLIAALLVAFISILLLESINYIEHYGLTRKMLQNGRYERVENFHSWNSDHEVGRILLYELTRHSDHHYKASKKYQILNHYDESPQLPYGYPTSILLALIPPLWFGIMNPQVREWRKHHNLTELS